MRADGNNLPAQSSSTVQDQPPPINMNTLAYKNIAVSKNPAIKRSLLSDLPKDTTEHIEKIKNPAIEKKVKEKDKQMSSEIKRAAYKEKKKAGAGVAVHTPHEESYGSLNALGIEIKNGDIYNVHTGKKIKRTAKGLYVVMGRDGK